MKYFLMIIILCSCSSGQKIKDLEKKIALLEKEQKIKKEEKPKEKPEKSDDDVSQIFKISLPKSESNKQTDIKKRINLGRKSHYNIDFLFILGKYWVELESNKLADPTLELQLLIEGGGLATKESLTLLKESDFIFYAYSHKRVGTTKFTLILKSKNRENESITFEVNLQ